MTNALNLRKNQSKTISLTALLKGRSNLRIENFKSIIAGLGHFNIDTSNKVQVEDFSSERAEIRVMFKNHNHIGLRIEKVNLFRENSPMPIDITKETKGISNIERILIDNYLIDNA